MDIQTYFNYPLQMISLHNGDQVPPSKNFCLSVRSHMFDQWSHVHSESHYGENVYWLVQNTTKTINQLACHQQFLKLNMSRWLCKKLVEFATHMQNEKFVSNE